MTIRILVADDHEIFADGLRSMLNDEPDMNVVGQARDGAEAVGMVAETKPHVVVMDVSMPGMNGIEATHQILLKRPETKVLCLSMHSEPRFVSAVLEVGAQGYLIKECAVEELIRGVHTVMAGQTYLSPSIAGPLIEDYQAHGVKTGKRAFTRLTSREREILQLLAEGHSTKTIAGRLSVSVKTVGTHRENLMRKLDIHSVAELTKYAIREGLTSANH